MEILIVFILSMLIFAGYALFILLAIGFLVYLIISTILEGFQDSSK